jgi:biotin-(acetyl-CoA carboxylase) ligase
MTWLRHLEGCQTDEQREAWLRQSMAVCHQRDGLKGHLVEICTTDGQRILGRAEGLADDGAFCLRTETGLQRFHVGEARIVGLSQSAGWEMS